MFSAAHRRARRIFHIWAVIQLLALGAGAQQGPAQGLTPQARPAASDRPPPWLSDPARIHDPSPITVTGGVRRVFCTGPGITLVREDAQGKWLREGRVFAEGKFPAWHEERVPGNRGYLWAPDVVQIGEDFFLYYSVSTFGKNRSAIGLAVGRTMDPSSSAWRWEDRGVVLESDRADRFNAIDPALFRDASTGALWMAFGSFWEGIHLVELNPATGLRRQPLVAPLRLASAPEIEAPFLYQHGDAYYLFLNWGKCCRGVDSTYEIRVGRSRQVTGPYLDDAGVDLNAGGGTLVLASEDRWIGPGHASIFEQEGRQWLVHHYYDREAAGRPRLRMVPLSWNAQGWPLIAPGAEAKGNPRAETTAP